MRKVQFNGVGHLSQPFELPGTDSSEIFAPEITSDWKRALVNVATSKEIVCQTFRNGQNTRSNKEDALSGPLSRSIRSSQSRYTFFCPTTKYANWFNLISNDFYISPALNFAKSLSLCMHIESAGQCFCVYQPVKVSLTISGTLFQSSFDEILGVSSASVTSFDSTTIYFFSTVLAVSEFVRSICCFESDLKTTCLEPFRGF